MHAIDGIVLAWNSINLRLKTRQKRRNHLKIFFRSYKSHSQDKETVMERDDGQQVRSLFSAMKFFALAIGMAFLLTGTVHAEESATAPESEVFAEPQQDAIVLAQSAGQAEPAAAIGIAGMALADSAGEDFESDPFEGFNE